VAFALAISALGFYVKDAGWVGLGFVMCVVGARIHKPPRWWIDRRKNDSHEAAAQE
jgi:hypothetical protein